MECMFRSSSRRQQLFREALSRESAKSRKNIDRGENFRTRFPYEVIGLWIIFLGVLVYLLCFSPFLMLSQPTIIPAGQVSPEEIQERLEPMLASKRWWVFPARNFFLFPEERVTQDLLAQYPVIESIRYERSFPNRLTILPLERTKLLLWCAGGPCAMLDAGERARFHAESMAERYRSIRLSVIDTSALPFQAGSLLPVNDYLTYFSRLEEAFPKRLGQTLLSEATTPSRFSRELKVMTQEGWSLLVNIDIPLEELLLGLEAFFAERRRVEPDPPLLTLDARVPGRIFFTEVVAEAKQETEEDKSLDAKSSSDKKKKER